VTLPKIFGHLLPSDLLTLSRVNKDFRQLLMSRRSLFLWKRSYNLVSDAPPCPEDMSEPAWAHLLFGGNYCYVCYLTTSSFFKILLDSNRAFQSCGAKPVTKILFSLRRRACKSCMRMQYVTASSILSDITHRASPSLMCASTLPKDLREMFRSISGLQFFFCRVT
jgi:hypothetical protein